MWIKQRMLIGCHHSSLQPIDWVSSIIATNEKNEDAIRIRNRSFRSEHCSKKTTSTHAYWGISSYTISNTAVFSVLHPKNFSWQLSFDDKSSILTTFTTSLGHYRFLRMTSRLNSASEVLWHAMVSPCTFLHVIIVISSLKTHWWQNCQWTWWKSEKNNPVHVKVLQRFLGNGQLPWKMYSELSTHSSQLPYNSSITRTQSGSDMNSIRRTLKLLNKHLWNPPVLFMMSAGQWHWYVVHQSLVLVYHVCRKDNLWLTAHV